MISNLSDAPYEVSVSAGDAFHGYRLHPAVTIDEKNLLRAARDYEERDPQLLPGLIEEHATVDHRLAEALAALVTDRSVRDVAQDLGVSARTLERLVLGRTGRSPMFWKNLGRVRRTALALAGSTPLAELAVQYGYSDQAHMSREIRRWLGLSPRQLARRADLLAMLAEPAYATGVQSSTRNPSGSAT